MNIKIWKWPYYSWKLPKEITNIGSKILIWLYYIKLNIHLWITSEKIIKIQQNMDFQLGKSHRWNKGPTETGSRFFSSTWFVLWRYPWLTNRGHKRPQRVPNMSGESLRYKSGILLYSPRWNISLSYISHKYMSLFQYKAFILTNSQINSSLHIKFSDVNYIK